MKKTIFILFIVTAVIQAFADEIPNTIGAVKDANPGDYIVLKDGSQYVLTQAEIDIANDEFDYNDVESLRALFGMSRSDGGMEFNITQGHKRIIWPDGKSMDILLTRRAFDAYINFLEANYDPIPFTVYDSKAGNTSSTPSPEGLLTYRGKVYRTFVTNGRVTLEIFEVNEFNRSVVGEGLKQGFQVKDGILVYPLTSDGNFRETN
jgi:hypothetical protein